MCLAYPVQVIAVEAGQIAVVSWRGGRQRVTLLATDERVVAGDWLLVQSGIALYRVDPEEAAHRRRLLDQLQGGQS